MTYDKEAHDKQYNVQEYPVRFTGTRGEKQTGTLQVITKKGETTAISWHSTRGTGGYAFVTTLPIREFRALITAAAQAGFNTNTIQPDNSTIGVKST